MRSKSIEDEKRPLREWLPKSRASGAVVYLTEGGQPAFAVVPLDDGDREVLAIRNNKKLMAHLEELTRRALEGPRKTLAAVKKKYGLASK
jgi:hypothetical protein